MGLIRFNEITTEEQGEYMCSATNEVGTVTETASLRVEGMLFFFFLFELQIEVKREIKLISTVEI